MKFSGERLEMIRAGRNMSSDDLAAAMDVSRQTIRNWEKEEIEPSLKTITKLMEIFGVSFAFFVHEESKKVSQ